MGERNRYGLARDPPEGIKRKVRQDCGFGCVICGLAFHEYAHFTPSFEDALEHNPDRIALLCPTHHAKLDRGLLPQEEVEWARCNPRCLQDGFSHDEFAYDREVVVVSLGSATFIHPRCVLRIHGEEILSIAVPERPGGPMRLSGRFYASDGSLLFEIRDNEWRGHLAAWDIQGQSRGKSATQAITVLRKPRDIALRLANRESQVLSIERLDMHYSGLRVYADGKGVRIGSPGQRPVQFAGRVRGAECCVDVRKVSDSPGEAQAAVVLAGGLVVEFGTGALSIIIDHLSFPAKT
jgi:hypothetical protein